jgi:long-subunit acyl-CoA synthetase (AMP-forming)
LRKTIINTLNDEKKTSPVKRWLFNKAFELKKEALSKGYDTPLLNSLVFGKLRGLIGGRNELLVSGGAALNPDTHLFIRIVFGSFLFFLIIFINIFKNFY